MFPFQLNVTIHTSTTVSNFISVLEPVLVEDLQDDHMPKTLVNVQTFFESKGIDLDKNDTLIILLYICMLEMGFVTKDFEHFCDEDEQGVDFNYGRILKLTESFPENWKNNDVYEFEFVLLPFPLYICSLAIIKLSDDMVINCSVKNIEDCSVCIVIDPSLYVLASNIDLIKFRFQNVRNMAILFKGTVSYKMKLSILEENNMRVACLHHLPPDILLLIVKYFDLCILGRFQQVCQSFRDLTEDSKLWKRLVDTECTLDNSIVSQKKLRKAYLRLNSLKLSANRKKLI